jgi:hypothetical protein
MYICSAADLEDLLGVSAPPAPSPVATLNKDSHGSLARIGSAAAGHVLLQIAGLLVAGRPAKGLTSVTLNQSDWSQCGRGQGQHASQYVRLAAGHSAETGNKDRTSGTALCRPDARPAGTGVCHHMPPECNPTSVT